jgi:hypothetical protein
LAVLHQAWQGFGLNTILHFVANPRTAGLLKAMTLGRIFFPSARLALVDHARGTLPAVACGVDQATEDFDEALRETRFAPPPVTESPRAPHPPTVSQSKNGNSFLSSCLSGRRPYSQISKASA